MRIAINDSNTEYIETSIFQTIKFFMKGWIKIRKIDLSSISPYGINADIDIDYDSIRRACIKNEKG